MRVRDIGTNLLGLGIPIVVALVCIPIILKSFSLENFGILSLAWSLIAISGALDLGVGRATTQYIAKKGFLDNQERNEIAVKSLQLTIIFSTLISIILFIGISLINPINFGINALSSGLFKEFFFLIIISIPLQSAIVTFRGIQEGNNRFGAANVMRITLTSSNFLIPVLFNDLLAIAIAFIIVRLSIFLLYFRITFDQISPGLIFQNLNKVFIFNNEINSLIRFSITFSIENIIKSLSAISDKWIIAAVLSAAALPYYTVPFDIVSQSLVIIGAITTTLFPRLSYLAGSQRSMAFALFKKWQIISFFLTAITAVAIFIFSDWFIKLWLQSEYKSQYVDIAKVLAFGLPFYAMATVSTCLLHADGKVKITLSISVLNAILSGLVLLIAANRFGIIGGAWAWVLKCVFDFVLLNIFARREFYVR